MNKISFNLLKKHFLNLQSQETQIHVAKVVANRNRISENYKNLSNAILQLQTSQNHFSTRGSLGCGRQPEEALPQCASSSKTSNTSPILQRQNTNIPKILTKSSFKVVADSLKKHFPNVPVLPSIGNHESFPVNMFPVASVPGEFPHILN